MPPFNPPSILQSPNPETNVNPGLLHPWHPLSVYRGSGELTCFLRREPMRAWLHIP